MNLFKVKSIIVDGWDGDGYEYYSYLLSDTDYMQDEEELTAERCSRS